MEVSLDALEHIWLKDPTKDFLASDKISIADISLCCDLEQILITSYDPFKNRPKVENLWKRVKALTNPSFDTTHAVTYKMAKSEPKF